jgi:hypothetical protein
VLYLYNALNIVILCYLNTVLLEIAVSSGHYNELRGGKSEVMEC